MTYADKYALMKAYKISTGDVLIKMLEEQKKKLKHQRWHPPNQITIRNIAKKMMLNKRL